MYIDMHVDHIEGSSEIYTTDQFKLLRLSSWLALQHVYMVQSAMGYLDLP
jgi:hypothetical protein